MTRKFGKGMLAYLIPTFPLGYLWHLVTFHDAYSRLEMYRADVIIPLGLTSMAIQAVFFSWAYPRLFSTDRGTWILNAARAALAFGVLSWSFTTLPVAAKYRMTSVPLFIGLETAFTAVQFLIVAPLLSFVMRDDG